MLAQPSFLQVAIAVIALVIIGVPLVIARRKFEESGRLNIGIILVLFFLALLVRVPELNRPLSCHFEGLTAMSLCIMENWQSQGGLANRFCLLQTYPLDADKFVESRGVQMMNQAGNGYYVSYPPFSIIFPYAVFSVLGLRPSAIGLQIINLIFHLVSAILIYLTVIATVRPGPWRRLGALLAGLVFIFLPANLWFFSNTYFTDVFWIFLWVIGLYLMARLTRASDESRGTGRLVILLGITMFCIVYTDNHGVLFAISALVYALIALRKRACHARVITAVIVASLAALLLTFAQYSTIAGPGELIRNLTATASRRSMLATYNPRRILLHYRHAYLAFIPLLLVSAGVLIRRRLKVPTRNLTGRETGLLLLAIAPVAFHHALMLEWTSVHEFSVLKTSVFLSLLTGIALARIASKPKLNSARACLVAGAVALTLILSLVSHHEHFAACTDKERYAELGETIKQNSLDTEVVFAIPLYWRVKIVHQITYYAGRNIQLVQTEQEAREWLEANAREKGVVFRIAKGPRISEISKISR